MCVCMTLLTPTPLEQFEFSLSLFRLMGSSFTICNLPWQNYHRPLNSAGTEIHAYSPGLPFGIQDGGDRRACVVVFELVIIGRGGGKKFHFHTFGLLSLCFRNRPAYYGGPSNLFVSGPMPTHPATAARVAKFPDMDLLRRRRRLRGKKVIQGADKKAPMTLATPFPSPQSPHVRWGPQTLRTRPRLL